MGIFNENDYFKIKTPKIYMFQLCQYLSVQSRFNRVYFLKCMKAENKMLSVRWLPSPIRSGIPCLQALPGLPPGALKLSIALCT